VAFVSKDLLSIRQQMREHQTGSYSEVIKRTFIRRDLLSSSLQMTQYIQGKKGWFRLFWFVCDVAKKEKGKTTLPAVSRLEPMNSDSLKTLSKRERASIESIRAEKKRKQLGLLLFPSESH
jgi:hypothetical protein